MVIGIRRRRSTASSPLPHPGRAASPASRTAARRKPHKHSHQQPDLFGFVGDQAPSFDPQKLVKWATGVWRSAIDARHAVLCERWAASQNLQLHDDIDGDVLRFHPNLSFASDRVPGLIWLLRDLFTDEPVSILRIFLDDDGVEIGRRTLGRVYNAAIKLDTDETVTTGLHIASSIEDGIAAINAGYRPVWSIIGASAWAEFPVIGGIEALTIVGDGDAETLLHEPTAK
jgi:hypothetical protein